ncbi:MAG TPA: metallophosphoesterase [Pyrinomonadaceae bacterium]|jgi:predicted phosphodiesterase|nr:metallophosphoesterase [Pyrinomonadaceae bacterium]
MNRTIVIGDIHGCFDELSELLEKVKLSEADRVVAVGDLTVKGPKSRQVLQLFSSDSRFSSVVGNHDLALVKYWHGETTHVKSAQQRCFEELKKSGDYLLAYLASLPTYIELETHVVVHGGLRQGITLNQQKTEDLIELRTLGEDRTSRVGTPWYEIYDGPKIALFGHWPASEPRRGKYAIGIDTGCVYGYQLTAYIIETDQFESVQARASYDMSGRGKKA